MINSQVFNLQYLNKPFALSNGLFSRIEVSGMSFTQSIEAPLTLRDTVTMSGQLGTQNGTGTGSINVSAKRLISSKGWVEAEVGAGNGPTFSLKGFRTLTKRLFCNGATIFQFSSHGVKVGYVGSRFAQSCTCEYFILKSIIYIIFSKISKLKKKITR